MEPQSLPHFLCHHIGSFPDLHSDMITFNKVETADASDADLVNESLTTGNREAFGRIVGRYQTLICSIAYSGTGSLSQSEDLAQETFIAAWKQLRHLREPHKLRSWLCGIARNITCDALKKQGREPSHEAETLEAAHESPAQDLPPHDLTMNSEEAAILWRSLERIPEIYREPLVLFYREHQSVEAVARSLELSEDAVKQRLSRGRKLLHEQVIAFVEGALERTNPGKVFTVSVLAALPAITISAKAATVGAAAAKGSATAKAAGVMGLLGAVLTPLLVIFGNYASYRMSLDEAHSEEDRGHIKALFRKSLYITFVFSLLLAVPLFLAFRSQNDSSAFWGLLFSQTIVVYFVAIFAIALKSLPARRRYLEGLLASEHADIFPPAAYEYRSRSSFLGLPLVHVRLGDRFDLLRGPVKAWIAIGGGHAVGAIFASGGIAIAPVSFGGIAIGLLPFGGFAMGLIPVGAFSLGAWAFGGMAIGWQAFCGCGLAWKALMGGIGVAHDFAVGGVVHAAQANTALAQQFIDQSLFFRCTQLVADHTVLIMLLWVIPVTLQAWIVKRARGQRTQGRP